MERTTGLASKAFVRETMSAGMWEDQYLELERVLDRAQGSLETVASFKQRVESAISDGSQHGIGIIADAEYCARTAYRLMNTYESILTTIKGDGYLNHYVAMQQVNDLQALAEKARRESLGIVAQATAYTEANLGITVFDMTEQDYH
tara:strand:+ start:102 stop:542 length:441 start_codon:yes stop_codon:yes gene_type:complete